MTAVIVLALVIVTGSVGWWLGYSTGRTEERLVQEHRRQLLEKLRQEKDGYW